MRTYTTTNGQLAAIATRRVVVAIVSIRKTAILTACGLLMLASNVDAHSAGIPAYVGHHGPAVHTQPTSAASRGYRKIPTARPHHTKPHNELPPLESNAPAARHAAPAARPAVQHASGSTGIAIPLPEAHNRREAHKREVSALLMLESN